MSIVEFGTKMRRAIPQTKMQVVLEAMRRDQGFVEAISTPLGKELLADLMLYQEETFASFVKGDCNQELRIRGQVIAQLLAHFTNKINLYMKNLQTAEAAFHERTSERN